MLTAAFTTEDYTDCVKDLNGCGVDPQAYIDGLDRVGSRALMFTSSTLIFTPHQIIDILSHGSEIYRRGVRALRKVCGIYGLLPFSYINPEPLTLVLTGLMKRPIASGGYLDVWKASDPGGCTFAVKQLRIYAVDDIEHVRKVPRIFHPSFRCSSPGPPPQKICKEIVIGRRIQHENVLSIEGVAPGLFEVCMVSKWMDNGNMLQYVRSHQGVDRMRLVSLPALRWSAE